MSVSLREHPKARSSGCGEAKRDDKDGVVRVFPYERQVNTWAVGTGLALAGCHIRRYPWPA